MSSNRHLVVSIDDQLLQVMEGSKCIIEFPISTSIKGMGFSEGSYRTPTGQFRISEKIGEGEPAGTIFKYRKPIGVWQVDSSDVGDLILTRILRIEGLSGDNTNTMERMIYLHGTNHEDKLGQPASKGCIRLSNAAMLELFEMVHEGMPLEIKRATRCRGKLFFIDCDSTLSTIEGIDELARARGSDVFSRVVELTHAAMNGEIPITEVFPRRMEMIRPDRELCDAIADLYVQTVVPGAVEMVAELKNAGWLPVVLSGGFAPLIRPLADMLGIDHVEAVPLYFNEDGSYRGYGNDYPTTRNMGKNEVIREWKQAILPEQVMMMGDGISDLETRPDVDHFIGFGGVVSRPMIKERCDHWLMDLSEWSSLSDIISG